MAPSNFDRTAARALSGTPVALTVRELLALFGASRRGANVVDAINAALQAHDLETAPSFADAWIDEAIELRRRSQPPGTSTRAQPDSPAPSSRELVPSASLSVTALSAAHEVPRFVTPDASVQEALTELRYGAYGVVAVLSRDRKRPYGVLTWREVALSLTTTQRDSSVRDALARWPAETRWEEVPREADLLAVARQVIARGFGFVRDADGAFCGPLTASGLALLFRDKLEPFVLAGSIEHALRVLVGEALPQQSTTGLSLGECQRELQNPLLWERLGLPLERSVFDKELEAVRSIRNDLMHFNADQVDERDVQTLRRFLAVLQDVLRLRAHG